VSTENAIVDRRAWVVRGALLGALLALLAIGVVFRPQPETVEATPATRVVRSDLELRDDQRLYVHGADDPFSGRLIEDFPGGGLKLEIEIREGKAHGRSRGWFENGQLEVEETFRDGVSNGRRRRWYANGRHRSEAEIVDGQLEGSYLEWHEGGGKAVEMTLKRGVPDGLARTWHPSGARKSEVMHDSGEIVSRQSWPDADELEAAPGAPSQE
jgi:antitoxin component YwqK of YwqJK toxin-antitoxin module